MLQAIETVASTGTAPASVPPAWLRPASLAAGLPHAPAPPASVSSEISSRGPTVRYRFIRSPTSEHSVVQFRAHRSGIEIPVARRDRPTRHKAQGGRSETPDRISVAQPDSLRPGCNRCCSNAHIHPRHRRTSTPPLDSRDRYYTERQGTLEAGRLRWPRLHRRHRLHG